MNCSNSRSRSMETASIVLAAVSLISCTCLYVSVTCGALAVIMGFLSTGGASSMSRTAMTGVCLGILGIVVCGLFYIYAYYSLLQIYGSPEGIIKAMSDTYGLDYSSLYSY